MNALEEEYTEQRMINFFLKNSVHSAEEFFNLIVEDVRSHVGDAEQSDDITSMILNKH